MNINEGKLSLTDGVLTKGGKTLGREWAFMGEGGFPTHGFELGYYI